MSIDIYSTVCWIVGLSLIGLVALVAWLLSLLFKKLKLTTISSFFDFILGISLFLLIGGAVIISLGFIVYGFFWLTTKIATFLLGLLGF
ncbi:MAG: hypothetical protein HFJ41_00210 [Clostridia bacterium]|nr:hypothetical protein [Clostridia bacterium]